MLISYLVKSTQNKKLYMRMSTYFTLILDIYQDRVDISHFKYTAHTYWTRARHLEKLFVHSRADFQVVEANFHSNLFLI